MKNCKKIMVHSYKGGCGKSITAIGLAIYFSIVKNQKVLLIEMDNSGPQFTDIFSVSPNFYLNDFYTNTPLREMLISGANLPNINSDDISIICSEQKPFSVPPGKRRKDYFMRVAERLRKQLWELGREYDYIIMDTPPGVNYSVINNFVVCDCIILMTRLDSTINRTINLYNLLKEFNKETIIIANMVPIDISNLSNNDLDSPDVTKRIQIWNDFIKGKRTYTIPQDHDVVIEIFKQCVPKQDGKFMSYIEDFVTKMTFE